MNRFIKKSPRKKSLIAPEFSNQDVFLVSYPRSGNTWVRFLLANLLKEGSEVEIDFHNVHRYVPEINRNNDIIKSLVPPRVIKSHALYQQSFPKVIYLVRDGRDVYVSYYYYRLKQLDEGSTFSDFLRREDHFPSSWKDHIELWFKNENPQQQVITVRYEDLLENPIREMNRMIGFIGITAREDTLQQAIEDSRFDKMKKIDQTKGRKYNLTGTKNFVRKGRAGSWRDEFSEDDVRYFRDKEGDMLIQLGYEKNQNW